jgi:hypothetical protein
VKPIATSKAAIGVFTTLFRSINVAKFFAIPALQQYD